MKLKMALISLATLSLLATVSFASGWTDIKTFGWGNDGTLETVKNINLALYTPEKASLSWLADHRIYDDGPDAYIGKLNYYFVGTYNGKKLIGLASVDKITGCSSLTDSLTSCEGIGKMLVRISTTQRTANIDYTFHITPSSADITGKVDGTEVFKVTGVNIIRYYFQTYET